MNIIGQIDPSAFATCPRMHHRLDESTPEFPFSVGSRARGLLALKAQNWRASGPTPWTNPYITDGLLGMWDAEWNEAGGVHNPELMQLNDLTGNLGPIPVYELGDKYAKRNTNAAFESSRYPKISYLVNSDSRSTPTFDFCNSFGSEIGTLSNNNVYGLNAQAQYSTSTSGTTIMSWNGGGANSNGVLFLIKDWLSVFKTTIPNRYDTPITFCSSGMYGSLGSDFVNGYVDGEKILESTLSRLKYSPTAVNKLVFVSLSSSTYYQFVSTHCIRLYNRVLTPEEVAHNAAVDARRFSS